MPTTHPTVLEGGRLSLQGSFDTFSLAEILGLVERARKTGALEVRDPASRGVLYFAGGRFSAAEAGELAGPVDSPDELDARLVDVCFALFRLEQGVFVFESDRFPPWPVRGGSEITPIVQQVQQIQRDWLGIEAVIPSLDCRPELVPDLGGDRIVLDKMGFRILRAVDGERSVRQIAREAGRSVLEVCRVMKDLVDAGAIEVPREPVATVVDELILPSSPTIPDDIEDLAVITSTVELGQERNALPRDLDALDRDASTPESPAEAETRFEREVAEPDPPPEARAQPDIVPPDVVEPDLVGPNPPADVGTGDILPADARVADILAPYATPDQPGPSASEPPAEPAPKPPKSTAAAPASRSAKAKKHGAASKESNGAGSKGSAATAPKEPADAPVATESNGAEADEPEPPPEAAPDQPAPDRGALLRLFSALRDT